MIIAGPCLFTGIDEFDNITKTAHACNNIGVDLFRCKIYGGGTSVDKYAAGVGSYGISFLNTIDKDIIKTGTEIHTPEQAVLSEDLSFLWVGARNSQNYSLLHGLYSYRGQVFIKRGTGMTIDETIGLFEICKSIYGYTPYIIERGINTFDRLSDSRWSPDLKGAIRIKNESHYLFDQLVIDCSHSVGRKEYIKDTYEAFKSIGCNHFMFECTIDGKSKTDQRHMLSVKELDGIIND